MKKIHTLMLCGALALAADLSWAQSQGVTCPAQDFAGFLKAFRKDVTVQKNFTKTPLTIGGQIDDNDQEIVKTLSAAQVKWPLILTEAEQKAQKLNQKSSDLPNGGKQVVIAEQDGDAYFVEYLFSKTPGCWQLIRINNFSL